ncbi:MAG: isoprenylcysteine carboxylmethyltransferase family protein [Hyphomonadaceae bacterium]|nr:isoprenylcysteine carboxylmethyltransferase family protein [Hyphomonadaceae bacterium]
MTDAPKPATAGVIAPPPLLLVGALLLGLGLDRLWPLGFIARFPQPARYTVAAILLLASAYLLLSASGRFGRAKTARAPWVPTTALVVEGVYTHTRNPMYLGFFLILAALGVALASDWCFATLVLLVLTIHFGVVLREERYLEGLFGADYRAYKRRVPRYLWTR